MNALTIRPLAAPSAPFGIRASAILLHQVLEELGHGHGADRAIDAAIYEALGWEVDRSAGMRRRLAWRCRSPLASSWEPLPSPTVDERAAALLVPYRWSWTAGVVDGQPRAWCRENTPRWGREPRFNECNRTTVARALASCALFAHRQIMMEG